MTNKPNTFNALTFNNPLPALVKWLLLITLLSIMACATAGRDFPSTRVPDIETGKTTKNEIRSVFGSPWRVGLEDGEQTWTYGRYRYKLFGSSSTKDLVVRFNDQNIVSSYSFNTTDHKE